MNPRLVLNEIKWKDEYDFTQVEISYIHRGATNDTKIIHGIDIVSLDHSFIQIQHSMIPYHRVFKIKYKEKIVFERKKK